MVTSPEPSVSATTWSEKLTRSSAPEAGRSFWKVNHHKNIRNFVGVRIEFGRLAQAKFLRTEGGFENNRLADVSKADPIDILGEGNEETVPRVKTFLKIPAFDLVLRRDRSLILVDEISLKSSAGDNPHYRHADYEDSEAPHHDGPQRRQRRPSMAGLGFAQSASRKRGFGLSFVSEYPGKARFPLGRRGALGLRLFRDGPGFGFFRNARFLAFIVRSLCWLVPVGLASEAGAIPHYRAHDSASAWRNIPGSIPATSASASRPGIPRNSAIKR
jgi:hypothetical protein